MKKDNGASSYDKGYDKDLASVLWHQLHGVKLANLMLWLKVDSLPVAWLLVFFSYLTLKAFLLLPVSTAHRDSENQNEQSVDCIKSFVRVLVLKFNDQLGVKYGGSKNDH